MEVVAQYANGWIYWCPGCDKTHQILWSDGCFQNQNLEAPTFMGVHGCGQIIRNGVLECTHGPLAGRVVEMHPIWQDDLMRQKGKPNITSVGRCWRKSAYCNCKSCTPVSAI